MQHRSGWRAGVVVGVLAMAGGWGMDPPEALNEMCPVMTEERARSGTFAVYKGKKVLFCCERCKAKFEREPERYLANLPQFAAEKERTESVSAVATGGAGATGTRLAPDEAALAELLFAPDNERAFIARRQIRLGVVPRPADPPSVSAEAWNEIDRFIIAAWEGAGLDAAVRPPPVCDDATFARRVYLDVLGRVPMPDELARFLEDRAEGKRARLVDDLLGRDEEYAVHWTPFWEDALGSTVVNNQGGVPARGNYQAWIVESFRRNKPFDLFAAELIDPTLPGRKPPELANANGKVTRTQYVLNHDHVSTLQTAANVAQVFMGTAMKCASCHSHFENPEWPQTRFLAYAGLFSGHDLEIIRCERPSGRTVPAAFCFEIPGAPEDVPQTEEGRLRRVAQLLTDPANPRFARSIVNRLWKRYFGLGLVEPADDFREDRTPSHPALLDWLAYDFMTHGYDLKHTIRLILTSRTYQLRYDAALEDHFDVATPTAARHYRSPSLRRLTAEQVIDSVRLVCDGRLETKDRLFRDPSSTALTRALGRPASRNEISTSRPGDIAVVQALELLNGAELATVVYTGEMVRQWAALPDDGAVVGAVFRAALSRDPTAEEQELAVAYLAEAPTGAEPPASETTLIDGAIPDTAAASSGWRWVDGPEGMRAHTQEGGGRRLQHYVLGLPPVEVHPWDVFYAMMYLDPADPPAEVMLQWNDGTPEDGGWPHRAFWGEDRIRYGQSGTPSRWRMGDLPSAGRWVRLEVPVRDVGFRAGDRVVGVSFDQSDGRVYWGRAGVEHRRPGPRARAIGDLVWALVVGPEFQHIR